MSRHDVWKSVVRGLMAGAGIMLALAFRVVYAVHTGHRWKEVTEFMGVKKWNS